MKIIIDIYGGDNAPLAPLKGAEMAVKELGVEIVAVGNEACCLAVQMHSGSLIQSNLGAIIQLDVVVVAALGHCDQTGLNAILNSSHGSNLEGWR